MRNTLSRSESLKSYKLIRLLFSRGKSIFSYPYKIIYIEQETESAVPVLFLISVSKKKIKTAVARNHIKRQFREAYRTNKTDLFDLMHKRKKQLLVAFVYVGTEKPEHLFMKDKTIAALQQLHRNISSLN